MEGAYDWEPILEGLDTDEECEVATYDEGGEKIEAATDDKGNNDEKEFNLLGGRIAQRKTKGVGGRYVILDVTRPKPRLPESFLATQFDTFRFSKMSEVEKKARNWGMVLGSEWQTSPRSSWPSTIVEHGSGWENMSVPPNKTIDPFSPQSHLKAQKVVDVDSVRLLRDVIRAELVEGVRKRSGRQEEGLSKDMNGSTITLNPNLSDSILGVGGFTDELTASFAFAPPLEDLVDDGEDQTFLTTTFLPSALRASALTAPAAPRQQTGMGNLPREMLVGSELRSWNKPLEYSTNPLQLGSLLGSEPPTRFEVFV
jgi:hypothetical protein